MIAKMSPHKAMATTTGINIDYEHTIETWFSTEFICATLGGHQAVSRASHRFLASAHLDTIAEPVSVVSVSEPMPIRL
jgi:MFS-type transporter involved in bile tolerance (Atg22 family)